MLVTDQTFAVECERVAQASDVTLDIEATGLVPWKGDRAVGLAVEVDGTACYFPFRHEGGGNLSGGLPHLLAALKGKRLRGYNLRYDLTVLSYEEDAAWCLRAETADSIIDALLANENEPSFSLAAISEKYLGADAARTKREMDELLDQRFPHVRSKRDRKGMLHKLSAAEVAPYACGDVLLPRALRQLYSKSLDQWGLLSLAREMNAYNLLLARMQRAGVRVDVDRCRHLSSSTEARKAALLADVRGLAKLPTLNPNSSPQVCRLLGTTDARAKTLERLGSRLAQGIVDYKKLGKAKSTYYDAILEGVDGLGYIHPQLNLTRDPSDAGGTKTGRLSCSGPNFQALPHADDDPNAIYRVRDLVVPRPGMKLLKLDYERAEVWMGASYCKSRRLIEAYHAHRDIYTEMSGVLHISRHQAKILFLMTQYGAGVWKIAETFGWTEAFAKDVRDKFFALYPEIRRAMYAYADAWEGTGVLRLWTGRAVHYPGDQPYAAWNRVIQGAVGEMVRQAMQTLEPLLDTLGSRMLLQCHDELLVEYPVAAEREVVRVCTHVMTNFDRFELRPRVEPRVSGTNYAEMSAYEETVLCRTSSSVSALD